MDRKGCHKPILILGLFLLSMEIHAQQNLVPNPSFEDTLSCPLSAGALSYSPPWEALAGSGVINFFHNCADECCGVPANRTGYEFARTGNGYVDLSLVHNNHVLSFHAESNFLGVALMDTLEADQRYMVEFYLSLYDSARFAGKNVGVYFSDGRPSNDDEVLITLNPQIRYEGDFLTDKEGWMRVSGDFIAEGGENYMTIGNFDGYFNSDTLNLHEGGVSPTIGYWEVAFYYIDDVSVVEDSSYHVGVREKESSKFSLWPNPATDILIVETSTVKENTFELMDMQGRIVMWQIIQSQRQQMDVSHLPTGVYVAVLRQKGVAVARRKVVIQR